MSRRATIGWAVTAVAVVAALATFFVAFSRIVRDDLHRVPAAAPADSRH